MANTQLASIQWGLFLSVVFLLPQLFFRQLAGTALGWLGALAAVKVHGRVQAVAPRSLASVR